MGEAGHTPHVDPAESSQSTDVPASRKRRSSARTRRSRGSRSSHWRLRIAYFSIASAWGFVMGTAAVLGSLSMLDLELPEDPTITFMLALAALAAIVGGAVTAMAYRDAVGRRQ